MFIVEQSMTHKSPSSYERWGLAGGALANKSYSDRVLYFPYSNCKDAQKAWFNPPFLGRIYLSYNIKTKSNIT
jgi:hypothetical protein